MGGYISKGSKDKEIAKVWEQNAVNNEQRIESNGTGGGREGEGGKEREAETTAEQRVTDFDGFSWRKVPKIELHCHLEGCIRFSTIIDEFEKQGVQLPYPKEDERSLREYFLMEKPIGSLEKFFEIFQRSQKIFAESEAIERVTEEVIIDKFNDNVKLLELRYSPAFIKAFTSSTETYATIHERVMTGVKNGLQKINNEMHVALICIGEASRGREAFEEVVEFCIQNKKDFVGFDNAGPEVDLEKFADLFHTLHAHGFGITIHACEDINGGFPQNAYNAVKLLKAERIGHGIQIASDRESIDFFRNTKTHFEICPSSNWITGSVPSLDKHPARFLYETGINLSISTDDPGLSGITLSGEYEKLHRIQKFSIKDFLQMNINALNASFVKDDVKQQIRNKHFPGCCRQ